MGAAWVLARGGHRAAAVTAESILVMAPTGSMLRIFRGEPDDPAAVLAWGLCGPARALGLTRCLQRGIPIMRRVRMLRCGTAERAQAFTEGHKEAASSFLDRS